MEERTRRIAANEGLFRTVNAKIEDLNEAFSLVTDSFEIVCECGQIGCAEQIHLTRDAYARLRSDPTRFAIIRGHQAIGVEDVIETHGTWEIVQKHSGLPTQLAQETAP